MSKDNSKAWEVFGNIMGGVAAAAAVVGAAYIDIESGAYDERQKRREAEYRQKEAEQRLAAERKFNYMRECERAYDQGLATMSVNTEIRFENKAIQNAKECGYKPRRIFDSYSELCNCYNYISSITELKYTSYGLFDDKNTSDILYYLRRAKSNW